METSSNAPCSPKHQWLCCRYTLAANSLLLSALHTWGSFIFGLEFSSLSIQTDTQKQSVAIYGRYRPSQSSLAKKHNSWQRMWWHYAQRSVLADVRKRLRKTSWSYLGQRLDCRRKYVNLYRMKLELLQKGQLVSKDILQELENMDRECDIDDILNYRTIAEQQQQVFGSAGVIGNPMGFARNVGFGLKDFISASRKGKLQSPVELLNGIAQGSKTLIGSTVYAVSSATSHFSKTAYKGLVAFTYDEQAASKMDERERHLGLHGEGVLNGFLEGLTGLLQSPIRGAEKHGLPGVISGIAMGTAGLVARPMASILEATGRTAQSIRNRSNPHESNRLRVRFPRPVARDRPLFPYSWEEAIGVSSLLQADGGRLKDETFVMCKTLRGPGKFLVLSEKLLLLVSSPYLVDLGSPQFVGVPPDPHWVIETEMNLKCIVLLDRAQEVVNIVGSNGETTPRDKRGGSRNRATSSAFVPLFHFSVELPNVEDAEGTLQVLMALIEKGKARRWDKNILHRSNIS